MNPDDLDKKLAQKHLLIIDDQNSMRSVVKSYFKNMGFEKVATAIDGMDALTYLNRNAVDLIICDWQMPKISGIELLQKIRSFEEMSTMPFLMMTSTSDLSAVQNAVASGVSDYMIKPFQPAQLGYKVVQLLSKSSHKARKLPVDVKASSDPKEVKDEAGEQDIGDGPVDLEDVV